MCCSFEKADHKRRPVSYKLPCHKNIFVDVLLTVVYHYDYYDSIPIQEELYKRAFPNMVFCGPRKDNNYNISIVTDVLSGVLAYQCLEMAIRQYPDFTGYLYINDDLILNWWNLINFDRTKIWQGALIQNGVPILHPGELNQSFQKYHSNWIWYNTSAGVHACNEAFKELFSLRNNSKPIRTALDNAMQNGDRTLYCSKGWADFFYIPNEYADLFAELSSVFYKHGVFLELAVATIIRLLDLSENTVKLSGHYLPELGSSNSNYFWSIYKTDIKFIHPLKLHMNNEFDEMNFNLLKHWVISYSKKNTRC